MLSLPDLLLASGINLRQVGNEYSCLCYAHDDHHPSMSVYRNGDGGWRAHCHSCGHHSDTIAAYCYLNDLDTKNPQHFLQAKAALEGGDIYTGKPFAIIENGITKLTPRPERTMLMPTADTKPPKMNWLRGKDGREWGEPAEVVIFRQPDGTHWMYEARWEIANTETGEIKKEPRVFSYGRRGSKPPNWECAHHLPPRPLFGLDALAKLPTAQVLVFEGARKAEAAQAILPMLACVGWAGGAKAWSRSDWLPIQNAKVILWPDADEPGRTCVAEIAQQLIAQGCTCFILNTDDKPESWDVIDAIKAGWDTDKTLAWAKANKGDAVKAVEKKTPENIVDAEIIEGGSYDQPTLTEDLDDDYFPDVPSHIVEAQSRFTKEHNDLPFPKDPVDLFHKFVVPPLERGMLPKVIEDYIFDRAEVINTDPAFGALTAIITCAGLIDDRIKLRVGHDWFESARLWGCIVGEPSTKKSPIMDAVLNSSARHLVKDVSSENSEIKRKQDIIDKRYAAKMKEYEKACIESDNHDMQMPDAPMRMEQKRVLCDNLTREGLEEVLRDMPRGVLLPQDELAGWIGSMDAYKSTGVKADRAFWLRAYNGGPMQVDKVGRGSFLIENWSVSIIGGIQPSKLKDIANQLDDDGLLQRFLVVCSDRAGGIGSERMPNTAASNAWQDMADRLYKVSGKITVEMSTDAANIRRDAVKKIYQLIEAGTISRAFTTHLGKWEGLTARMMLTFHCVECAESGINPDIKRISSDTASLAIDYMMQHLLPHAVSFYEDGLGSSDIQDTARIMAGRILAEEMGELTMRWLGRNSPSRWRNMTDDKQRQVLARLIESGWIIAVGISDSTTRRHGRYLVNPIVHEIFAHKQAEESAKFEAARTMSSDIKDGKMARHNKKIY